jgi:CheY-like chemotaxis protein
MPGRCAPPAAAARRRPMAKILVIDDDAMVRETITQILEDLGHRVMIAEDGRSGVAAFRAERPDLVITDIIMLEQEGIQTITEIRGLSPETQIIAISGGGRIGNTDFLRIARHIGANDVIAKPFDPDDLATRVATCLAASISPSTG